MSAGSVVCLGSEVVALTPLCPANLDATLATNRYMAPWMLHPDSKFGASLGSLANAAFEFIGATCIQI